MELFDLNAEPLSNPELQDLIAGMKQRRSKLVIWSSCSDISHALIFAVLYFGKYLSGKATLLAVLICSAAALFIAMSEPLERPFDNIRSGVVALMAALANAMAMHYYFQAAVIPIALTTALCLSSVILAATLGRQVKKTLQSIEDLKTIRDDACSLAEISTLCQRYPRLEEYRQQASLNLRPSLTYAELSAMRRWHAQARSKGS